MALSKWVPEHDPKILRRVGKTAEEASELAKVCARIIIQGLDGIDPASGKTNRVALSEELADVMAQCSKCIEALDLDKAAMFSRSEVKKAQMDEWEAMFEPQNPGELWAPRFGELVRYDDGSTALALHGTPHAGGWHGTQCMGGTAFYSKVYPPTKQDRITWAECAIRWRKVPPAQALAEAGLSAT